MNTLINQYTNNNLSDFKREALKTYLKSVYIVSVIEKVHGKPIELAQILWGVVEIDETGRFGSSEVVISSPIQLSEDHNTRFITKSGSYYVSCEDPEEIEITGNDWLKMRNTLLSPREILCFKHL